MENASSEEIAAAEAYEELHVPALFAQWPPLVLGAANVDTGDDVLDVACGTGVLARHALKIVGSSGSVVGLDAGPGMLAVANRITPAIDWREGVAESLPFEDTSFNVVVSQFGLMFFQDPHRAVQEMLRVLVPKGRLAVAVWEDLSRSEAYPIEVELLRRMAGDDAAEALKAPFTLGDTDGLSTLLQSAGVGSLELKTHHGVAHFPSITAMVEADLRGWLPVMGVELEEDLIQAILRESETALEQFVHGDGSARFRATAHIAHGKKPGQ